MKKYKQTEIPEVSIIEPENRIKFIKDFYTQNLQGKTVVNKDILLAIHFTSIGKFELAYSPHLMQIKSLYFNVLTNYWK